MLCVCEKEKGERLRFHTSNQTAGCVNALVSNGVWRAERKEGRVRRGGGERQREADTDT